MYLRRKDHLSQLHLTPHCFNSHRGIWYLLSHWGAPPTPTCKGQAPGARGASTWHTAVSACLSHHFNCYISSALIWAKREASAEPGTSKATSPSLTSCLSLWRSAGFGEPEKGIGEAVWIPGWNEFDGLIVAPSGHRHSSQRAGREGSWSWAWGAVVAGIHTPASFTPSSPDICTRLSGAFDCPSWAHMDVRNIPNVYHSFPHPFASFIVLHISVFLASVKKNLATPPSCSSLFFLTRLHFFFFFFAVLFLFLRCSCRPNLLTLTFTIGRNTFSRRSRTLMMQAHQWASAQSARRSLHLISPSDHAEPQQQITKGV